MKPILLAKEIQEIIVQLCKVADFTIPSQPLEGFQIPTRKMGFRISSSETVSENSFNADFQNRGKSVAEMMWKDTDGSPAFASLSQDLNGNLFELDIWKSNFSLPSTLSFS